MSFFCFLKTFQLRSIFSDISIATPALFWLLFAWNVFFCPLTFSVICIFVFKLSLLQTWQNIVGSYVFIHSANLYFLTEVFNLFPCKLITDKESLTSVICYLPSSFSPHFLHYCLLFVFAWFFFLSEIIPFFLFCIYTAIFFLFSFGKYI